MPNVLRLASYNVEWFTELFDDANEIVNDHSPSARHGVTKAAQFAAIGAVFQALDADGVMVIEAPDTGSKRRSTAALERFAAHFNLRACAAVTGYISETEQEISFLYDPKVLTATHAPEGEGATSAAPMFDAQLGVDYDGNGTNEVVRFSKPPLELDVQIAGGGALRLIGVHAKSKAAQGADGDAEYIRTSIQNRRKQLAECFWIRARVDQILGRGAPLIVLGDLNDGPGLDEYERMFGYSSVEVVAGKGTPENPPLFDPHIQPDAKIFGGHAPTTARFWYEAKKSYYEALIDFIMVSPELAARRPSWRIWHPFHDPNLANTPLAQAILTASDHFPVTIDIPLPITPPLP